MADFPGTFELESGELDEELIPKKKGCCKMFPLEILPCIPSGIRQLIPTQFHLFQGWIHIWLLIGFASCLALAVHSFVMVYQAFSRKEDVLEWGIQGAFEMIFMVPCLFYFVRTLGQYDDDFHRKKAMAEAARVKLIDAYMNTVDDMTEVLDNAAEVNSGFAERTFEAKRRDFVRFLSRWQDKFGSAGMASESMEVQELYKQLKRFILNWFDAFEECSIDPLNAPNRPVSKEELERCTTFGELCMLCIERLKSAEVRFITVNLERDKGLIEKNKTNLKAITFAGDKIGETFAQPKSKKKSPNPWVVMTKAAGKGVGYITGMSWCVCGCKHRGDYRLEAGLEDDEGYPCLVPFGCGIMVVLSREHIILMSGFCFGWVIFGLELWHVGTKKRMLALVSVCQFCLLLTLIRFEKIDILQRLARETRNIRKEKEELQERHRFMKAFWKKAQQQSDLWLHRTVPRLDLLAEVHTKLEDMDSRFALEGMTIANSKLELLHSSLGPLEYWFTDGQLTEEQKKQFDQHIANICLEQQFPALMVQLDRLNETMKVLIPQHKALPPRSPTASRSTTVALAPRQVRFQEE